MYMQSENSFTKSNVNRLSIFFKEDNSESHSFRHQVQAGGRDLSRQREGKTLNLLDILNDDVIVKGRNSEIHSPMQQIIVGTPKRMEDEREHNHNEQKRRDSEREYLIQSYEDRKEQAFQTAAGLKPQDRHDFITRLIDVHESSEKQWRYTPHKSTFKPLPANEGNYQNGLSASHVQENIDSRNGVNQEMVGEDGTFDTQGGSKLVFQGVHDVTSRKSRQP